MATNRLVILVLLLAVSALGFAGRSQILAEAEKALLFDPWPVDTAWLESLPSRDRGVEEVRLVTPDGVTLHGWLKRPLDARAGRRYPLVIVYGGVRHEVSEFVESAVRPRDWGWLVVNYRGFGLSGGAPSEKVVLQDAKLVYDWAAARPDVDASNIVLLGRSLGTYVAVAVAAARHVRAMILATPFDSFVSLGEKYLPRLPVEWVVGGKFDSASLAPAVHAPALFVLAEKDEVTPVEHGLALAMRWGGWTKTVLLRGAQHSGIEERADFWSSVGDFLGSISRRRSSSVR